MGSEKPQKTTTFLVVRDGVKPDWVAIWDTVEITVGRHDSQDIAVRESEVSRKHCVLRQKGGVYTVEDLGSALGTHVNGQPIKVHELKSGDVITVGSTKIKFGQTTSPVKPGSNVYFSSQLKGFSVPGSPASAEAGRTMMAIDLSDSMTGAPPTLPKAPSARAVSLDGQLEESEVKDLSGGDLGLGGPAAVRDLDASLAEFDDGLGPPAQPLAPPAPRASTTAPRAPAAKPLVPAPAAKPLVPAPAAKPLVPTPAATPLASAPPRAAASGDVRVQLVLEIAGPAEQVEALVGAVREKPIQIYPLTLCVKDPRKS
jgi:predicted component of type VI protein secretion system